MVSACKTVQTKLVTGNSWIERDGEEMVYRADTNAGIKPATFTRCNHFCITQFLAENKKKKISCTVCHKWNHMIDVQLWEPVNNIICMNKLILEIMLAPSTNYNQTLIEWRNLYNDRYTCMLVAIAAKVNAFYCMW